MHIIYMHHIIWFILVETYIGVAKHTRTDLAIEFGEDFYIFGWLT